MAGVLPRGNFACLRHRCAAGWVTTQVSCGLIQPRQPGHYRQSQSLSACETSTQRPGLSSSGTSNTDSGDTSQPVSQPVSQITSRHTLPPFENTSRSQHISPSESLAPPTDALLSSLPISPLLDESFINARSKWSQPKPKRSPFKPNSFRRKIASNPFAQILATPDRLCPVTKVHIPRGCLQSFRLMAHPTTGAPWWVPSDLLPDTPRATPSIPDGESQLSESTSLGQGPTSYTLPRIDLLRGFTSPSGKYRNGHKTFLRSSSKPGLQSLLNTAIWREDMDVHILKLMCRRIYADLVYLAKMCESQSRHYLIPLEDPGQLLKLYQKGCIFYLPGDARPETPGQEWSGLDLPVYPLQQLLGPELCDKLCSEHSVFQLAPAVLLRGLRTVELQKRLWKLYGYNI